MTVFRHGGPFLRSSRVVGFLDNVFGRGYLWGMTSFQRVRISVVTAAFLWGCSGRPSTPPVAEKRFVELYVRVEQLNRRYAASPDSLRMERDRLFRAEGVRREDLEREIAWYRDHPERAAQVLDEIARRLEKAGPEKKNTEYRIQNTGEKSKP